MNDSKNNIIAVASGKGGVGKTWLAVTLAHLFARSGRHVLLFDGYRPHESVERAQKALEPTTPAA